MRHSLEESHANEFTENEMGAQTDAIVCMMRFYESGHFYLFICFVKKRRKAFSKPGMKDDPSGKGKETTKHY